MEADERVEVGVRREEVGRNGQGLRRIPVGRGRDLDLRRRMICLQAGVETGVDLLHARVGTARVDDSERSLPAGKLLAEPLTGQASHDAVVERHLDCVLAGRARVRADDGDVGVVRLLDRSRHGLGVDRVVDDCIHLGTDRVLHGLHLRLGRAAPGDHERDAVPLAGRHCAVLLIEDQLVRGEVGQDHCNPVLRSFGARRCAGALRTGGDDSQCEDHRDAEETDALCGDHGISPPSWQQPRVESDPTPALLCALLPPSRFTRRAPFPRPRSCGRSPNGSSSPSRASRRCVPRAERRRGRRPRRRARGCG